MEQYLKAVGLILVSVILSLMISAQNKNFTTLLILAVCCMVGVAALQYLSPVITLFRELQQMGGWDNELLSILIKAVGLGMVSEITVLICNDSGNSALGKTLQMLSNAVILWIGIPLFTSLIELIKKILGGI